VHPPTTATPSPACCNHTARTQAVEGAPEWSDVEGQQTSSSLDTTGSLRQLQNRPDQAHGSAGQPAAPVFGCAMPSARSKPYSAAPVAELVREDPAASCRSSSLKPGSVSGVPLAVSGGQAARSSIGGGAGGQQRQQHSDDDDVDSGEVTSRLARRVGPAGVSQVRWGCGTVR
jgi:hypothetical protein